MLSCKASPVTFLKMALTQIAIPVPPIKAANRIKGPSSNAYLLQLTGYTTTVNHMTNEFFFTPIDKIPCSDGLPSRNEL